MKAPPIPEIVAVAQGVAAPQHGPRPLPLFLDMLWRHTHDDVDLRRRAFLGLRRYQDAVRPPPAPEHPVVAAVGHVKMLHFGDAQSGNPVVFIPSLINPPRILDISADRSMLRHMTGAGHDIYLVDWGTPDDSDHALDLTAHVTDRLLPLLATLDRAPVLVGYCLGGTLALGAAKLAGAKAVATIASPWDFSRYPAPDQHQVAALWRSAKPVCQRLGYTPMEVLQSGFWSLDPIRTIRKYAAFAEMADGSPAQQAFLAIEDWANEGPPLTFAAAQQLFDGWYAGNETGEGRWHVGGERVDPVALTCPTLSICSSTDRIVPAAAAPPLKDSRTLGIGHVGMIVGSSARNSLWSPLSDWLSSVSR